MQILRRLPIMSSIVLFLFTARLGAQDTSHLENVMSLGIRGFEERQDLLNTTITVGEGITKAFRIYAEPSHTLLLLAVDATEMSEPRQTLWWRHSIGTDLPSRVAFARVPGLVGKTLNLQSRSYPQSDTHLDIYVYGVWPDGEERDALFGHFYVKRPFSFSYKIGRDPGTMSTLDLFCCGTPPSGCTGDCTTSCKPQDIHSCCEKTEAPCGNCGKTYAQCGWCPFC